ncbi:MAG TPA: hypothetical protein VFB72_09305 [Verrucomicrobiae bacterium]|nr:hypothetical protein [Verrucomicrobiae bacterium]
MRILGHLFFAQAFSVQEQFELLAVAESPYVNFLTFFARPIPVREQMQNNFLAPAGLQIIENIFGKSAGVHDPVVGTDVRPVERGRLAAVIKSRPQKHSGNPWARRIIFYGFFGRMTAARFLDIVSRKRGVGILVNAARVLRRAFLSADAWFLRMIFVKGIRVALVKIIETLHIKTCKNSIKLIGRPVIERGSAWSCWIQLVNEPAHRNSYCPIRVSLLKRFFIGD